MTVIRLGQCSHIASSNLPGRQIRHDLAVLSLARTSRCAVPIRFCSRCGLPCRHRCRRRGALLPHLFTLTRRRGLRRYGAASPRACRAEARKGEGGRFVLCGTFPGVAPAGRYPAPYVDGARTFLPGGLSTGAGAAVRPTDAPPMRTWRRSVKRRENVMSVRRRRRPAVLRREGRRAVRAGSSPSIGRRCRRPAPGDSGAGTR